MRDYEVTLYFAGSRTFYVNASEEGEAEEVAMEMLSDLHELGDDLEITDCESHEDDDPEGLY
jgi:menaquinone-dependent protoporphyrinogen IX oxidase